MFALLSLLYYWNVIDFSLFSIFKLLTIIISFLFFGFILGKETSKKGYLQGVKYSGLWIFFLFIITLIIHKFQLKSIIFYIIILFCSILGSILGINKKK